MDRRAARAPILQRPLTRRRALGGAAALGFGAAFLAACGGGSDSKPASTTGLLIKPVDTTKQAKRGGVLKSSTNTDPPFLDPHGGGPQTQYYELAYHRLVTVKPGYLEPSQDDIEPAVAESWDWSPDHLTFTAKLRPNVKFHNIAPVNGRLMTTDDILFSWKRFAATGSNRATVANSANPDAPVLSMTAPDAKTIVVKFKEPVVYATAYLAQRGYVNIVPKEAESQFDLRSTVIGTGHYYLSEYKPSIGLTFKRFGDYWEKDRPYADQIEYPIVPEYATGLSQFRAGNIYAYDVKQEDILATKADTPQLNMYGGEVNIESRRTVFGWQDPHLRDKRVRQALSMALDRDAWIAAQYNTQTFESQGLPIEKRWNTSVQGLDVLTGWWLDPKGKDFGPNARYYQHDLAEAKKLLAAAGFPSGIEIKSNFFTSTQNGADYTKLIEIFEGMVTEAGVKLTKNVMDYTDYLRNYRDTAGKYDGLAYKSGPPAPSSDAVAWLSFEFSTKGGIGFHGFDLAGKGDGSGDPYVEAQLDKAKAEFDTESRRKIVHDLQRYLADAMYTLRWPGGATSFALAWPAIKNYGVWRPGTSSSNIVSSLTWWLDDTQAPLKKA